jgi:hypothetical protein
MMIQQSIALVADEVDPAVVTTVAAALQTQVNRDFGPIWGVSAAVDAFTTLDNVPLSHWPIIVTTKIDQPGAEGYHTDRNNQPLAIVQFDDGWTLTASHECLEMLADPFGNRLVSGPSVDPSFPNNIVSYLLEVCDPCEDPSYSYKIGDVTVSDFITPAYHGAGSNNGRFSFTGSVTKMRQILNNGYISWVDPQQNSNWFQASDFGGKFEVHNLGPMTSRMSAMREWVHTKQKVKVAEIIGSARAMLVAAAAAPRTHSLAREARAQALREDIAKIK